MSPWVDDTDLLAGADNGVNTVGAVVGIGIGKDVGIGVDIGIDTGFNIAVDIEIDSETGLDTGCCAKTLAMFKTTIITKSDKSTNLISATMRASQWAQEDRQLKWISEFEDADNKVYHSHTKKCSPTESTSYYLITSYLIHSTTE